MNDKRRARKFVTKRFFALFAAASLCPAAALGQVTLSEQTSSFGRTIYVHATGASAANGLKLKMALESTAIAARSNPASEPFEVLLGPGQYQVPGDISIPDYVSLRGAGIGATTISCAACVRGLDCNGTNNLFSYFTIQSNATAITADNDADVLLLHVEAQGNKSVGIEGVGTDTRLRIKNSTVLSTGDDAVFAAKGTLDIEHSVIDGADSGGNGIIRGDAPGNPELNISYSFVGPAGTTTQWPGGSANCAYITSGPPLAAVVGCP